MRVRLSNCRPTVDHLPESRKLAPKRYSKNSKNWIQKSSKLFDGIAIESFKHKLNGAEIILLQPCTLLRKKFFIVMYFLGNTVVKVQCRIAKV